MTKGASTAIDVYVGQRIRMRRNALGLSQAVLARALDVSFQQIQKYEKGQTRVGGNRLQALARALDVSIIFFFEEVPGNHTPTADAHDFINEFLADKRGIEVARHFVRINNTAARNAILEITEVFATIAAEQRTEKT